jgi:hypothetical protein
LLGGRQPTGKQVIGDPRVLETDRARQQRSVLFIFSFEDEPLIKLRFCTNTANRNLTDLFVKHVLELLCGPTPDAFVCCHIAVCDFEDRTARFWANYYIFKTILLREVNHEEILALCLGSLFLNQ